MREFASLCPFCLRAYLGSKHVCDGQPVLSEFQEGAIVRLELPEQLTERTTIPWGSHMEGILSFMVRADVLREVDIARARVELGEKADQHFVFLTYGALPLAIQAWIRNATDEGRLKEMPQLARLFLRFVGFLDADDQMPDVVKESMQPIMEMWRD
jgi:hypothetical protein